MKYFAQTLDLKDDPQLIRLYKEHHARVWPEVLSALRALGISRMRIFLVGTRLFMYYEAPDEFEPLRDYQTYANDPRCAAWDTLMRTFQQRIPASQEGAWWTPMEPIFDLESA